MLHVPVVGICYQNVSEISPDMPLHMTITITQDTWRIVFLKCSPLKPVIQKFINNLKKENFSVQLSEANPFGRCELDKVIKTTVNKNTKTPGGLTCFSTKTDAYCASLYSHLQEFLGENTKPYVVEIYKIQE